MTWAHRPTAIAAAARDIRIARAVRRKLRTLGISSELLDIRDVYGARLAYANLSAPGALVLCRSAGYRVQPHSAEAGYLARTAGAYLQCGAADVSKLVEHIHRRTNPFAQ